MYVTEYTPASIEGEPYGDYIKKTSFDFKVSMPLNILLFVTDPLKLFNAFYRINERQTIEKVRCK